MNNWGKMAAKTSKRGVFFSRKVRGNFAHRAFSWGKGKKLPKVWGVARHNLTFGTILAGGAVKLSKHWRS